MIQLQTHQIFDDVFASDASKEEKQAFLETSKATEILVEMSANPEVKFSSGNKIRNGYMGFVIKLANLIVKKQDQFDSSVFSSTWADFINSELEPSNERNSRNLGGRPTSTTSDDDETNQFDVNMDNIMKRFKCFNTIMQTSTSTDDDNNDEEEEEDNTNEPEGEGDTAKAVIDTTGEGADAAADDEAKTKIEVQLPEMTRVDSTYSDSGYWKVDALEDGLDELLKDYE